MERSATWEMQRVGSTMLSFVMAKNPKRGVPWHAEGWAAAQWISPLCKGSPSSLTVSQNSASDAGVQCKPSPEDLNNPTLLPKC